MSGLERYLEDEFLSKLANEVTEDENVSANLKAADLTKEELVETKKELVEAILNEKGLKETIERAISDPVAQADRLGKEIDDLRHEIRVSDKLRGAISMKFLIVLAEISLRYV